MATTSTYLLPYPILTDAVNVHGNIKSLADRLEVVLGTKSNLASPIFTGTVVTPAGTATSSPLTLTSGTLKTTPVGGSIEYDGDSAYITPDASAVGGRAVIPAMHYYRLDAVRSLTNALGVQSLFGVSFTAAASTTYDFEIVTSVNTTGAVSNSLAFGFVGTAGVTACTYLAVTTNGLANITPNASSSVLIQTASSTAITAAVAAAVARQLVQLECARQCAHTQFSVRAKPPNAAGLVRLLVQSIKSE